MFCGHNECLPLCSGGFVVAVVVWEWIRWIGALPVIFHFECALIRQLLSFIAVVFSVDL